MRLAKASGFPGKRARRLARQAAACLKGYSPRLAAAASEALIAALIDGSFPLRLPVVPLSSRPSLLPIEA